MLKKSLQIWPLTTYSCYSIHEPHTAIPTGWRHSRGSKGWSSLCKAAHWANRGHFLRCRRWPAFFALGLGIQFIRYVHLVCLVISLGTWALAPWALVLLSRHVFWQTPWTVPPLKAPKAANHLSTAHAFLPLQSFILPWLSAIVWGYFWLFVFFFSTRVHITPW